MHVHFTLKADLCFSNELGPDARAAVDVAVKEANGQLFCKGVPKDVPPEEVGRITLWDVEENILFLGIESGGYTRAHDALFRFRKLIGSALGKHHLGLREIRVREFRVSLTGDVTESAIPRIPFIRSAKCEAGRVVLDLQVTTQDLENRVPDRIVKLIEEKVQAAGYGGKTEHWELLYESPKEERTYTGNPTDEMEARHWIRHGSSRGQWIYGPQPIQLFRAFTAIVEEEIIKPLGFSEMVFPKVDTWDVLSRSGHAKGVYPEIYYVCTPKTRDPAFWEDVADYFKVTGEVPVEMLRERIDGPIGALCYAQCPSFWPFVLGRTVANSSLPVKIFDRSGTSPPVRERGDPRDRAGGRVPPDRDRLVRHRRADHQDGRGAARGIHPGLQRAPGARVAVREGHPLVHGPGGDGRGLRVRIRRNNRLRGLPALQRRLARVPERLGEWRQVSEGLQREDPERGGVLVRLLGHRARAVDRGIPGPEGLRSEGVARSGCEASGNIERGIQIPVKEKVKTW